MDFHRIRSVVSPLLQSTCNCLMQSRQLIAATVALWLSGCVTMGEYQTVKLDEIFESGAQKIDVRAPVRRYRDSFFNVPLAPYQVVDTSVGKVSVTDRSREPVGTVTEDDTLWNLIFNQDLKAEKVTYKQYRVDEQGDFSFGLVGAGGVRVDTQCTRQSVFLENEEVSRVSVGLGNVSDENAVERHGEWLGARLQCTVAGDSAQWTLDAVTSAQTKPTVSLKRRDGEWDTRLLDDAVAAEPGVGGRVAADEFVVTEGDIFSGVAMSRSGEQAAAVSVVPGNAGIWLDASLTHNARIMMVASGYALILNRWLTE